MGAGVAPGERLEQPFAHPLVHARPGVVHLDRDRSRLALHDHLAQAVAVRLGVVDEVADDPLESAGVGAHDGQVAHDEAGVEAALLEHLPAQGGDVRRLPLRHLVGADPADLEQVEEHVREPADLLGEDGHQARLALGQIAAAGLQQLRGAEHRRQGRAQLVADVGAEAALASDPRLHGLRHLVEGVGDGVEVGIAGQPDPGAELPVGDPSGTRAQPTHRTQDAADGRRADHGAHGRGQEGEDDQDPTAPGERPVQVAQREDLDVGALVDGDRDDVVRVVGDAESLAGSGVLGHRQERVGKGVGRHRHGCRVPDVLDPEHRLGRTHRRDLGERIGGGQSGGQVGARSPGVQGRPRQGGTLALVEQVPRGEGVRHGGHRPGHQQGQDREGQRDARPQAQPHAARRVTVTASSGSRSRGPW